MKGHSLAEKIAVAVAILIAMVLFVQFMPIFSYPRNGVPVSPMNPSFPLEDATDNSAA